MILTFSNMLQTELIRFNWNIESSFIGSAKRPAIEVSTFEHFTSEKGQVQYTYLMIGSLFDSSFYASQNCQLTSEKLNQSLPRMHNRLGYVFTGHYTYSGTVITP